MATNVDGAAATTADATAEAATEIATSSILENGSQSAEIIVKGWIRKVFRETSLQVLRQQWRHNHDGADAAANADAPLEITESMLQKCHQVCESLGEKWGKRLHERGQTQVSAWVMEVADAGHFWQAEVIEPQLHSDDDDKEIPREPEPATITVADTLEDSSIDKDDANVEEGRPIDETDDHHSPLDAPFSDTKLPLAKLRKLYKSNRKLADWKAILDKLGCSGQTQWPQQDWHLIQEYCQTEMVDRLYKNRGKRVQFEVIPKELVTTSNANDDQEEECAIQSVRIQELLHRKRKAKDTPSRRSRQRPLMQMPIVPEARDPSDHPESLVWDWEAEKKTIVNKGKLERDFLHADLEFDPPNTIIGALRTTGHTFFYQCGPPPGVMTDKQRRRALRASIKQRIANAEVLRDERKTPNTKVVRTRTSDGRYRVELDIGECLLEMNGKLHAFSYLEVSLDDEDAQFS